MEHNFSADVTATRKVKLQQHNIVFQKYFYKEKFHEFHIENFLTVICSSGVSELLLKGTRKIANRLLIFLRNNFASSVLNC